MRDNMIARIAVGLKAELQEILQSGRPFEMEEVSGLSLKLALKALDEMRRPTEAMEEALLLYDSNPVSLYERAIDTAISDRPLNLQW